jgi:hypothetical protein
MQGLCAIAKQSVFDLPLVFTMISAHFRGVAGCYSAFGGCDDK